MIQTEEVIFLKRAIEKQNTLEIHSKEEKEYLVRKPLYLRSSHNIVRAYK